MQVEDIEKAFSGEIRSKFSKFLKFLFVARLIPVSFSYSRSSISFKLCSCETLTYILLSWGVLSFFHGINIYYVWKNQNDNEEDSGGNPIDRVVLYFYDLLSSWCFLCAHYFCQNH